MSEKTYKSLRRALPMTRSKMDWDRVFDLLCSLLLELTKRRCWVISLVRSFQLEKEAFRDLVVMYNPLDLSSC